VQAAGRADREGKLTATLGRPGGRVVVFRSPDDKTPPNEYKEATELTRVLCNERKSSEEQSIQVDDPRALSNYFRRYYGQEAQQLGQRFIELRELKNFRTLAEEFEMISNRTKDVYVGHDEDSRQLIGAMEKQFREKKHFTPELRKVFQQLQRSIVGLGPWEFDKAIAAGVVLPEVVKDSGIWIAADKACTERFGLALEMTPENFVL